MQLPPTVPLRRLLQQAAHADPEGWLYLRKVPDALDDVGFIHVDIPDEPAAVQNARALAWAEADWLPYLPVEELQALLRERIAPDADDPARLEALRAYLLDEAAFYRAQLDPRIDPDAGDDDDDDESDGSPGWDAIDAACARLYPDQEPRHFGTLVKSWMGGHDPLDGISAYKRLDPQPHWHFVTYGLSDLYQNSHDGAHSGWGLELSFRLACAADAIEPPNWALNFLQNLARYVNDSRNVFRDGDWMSANGPIALETDTLLRSMGFVLDPELGTIDTPNGSVAFLQVVGLTAAEEAAARRWKTRNLLDVLQPAMPLWITDLSRPCLLQREDLRRQVQAGCEREGSSSGILHTDVLDWRHQKRLLRTPLTEIVLGARQAGDLAELLPLRLPFGREFALGGNDRMVMFQPAQSDKITVAGDTLVLHLTDATVRGLATTLRTQAGRYVTPGLPQLCWQVEPTQIRDHEGRVVETIE